MDIAMNTSIQSKKAKDFLALHHDPKLLVLPNIWDPLGAKLLGSLGYPAIATASAAVAYSMGYDDGQKINFDLMLDVIRRIADSVQIPLTTDIESGYAENPKEVAENVRQVLGAGAVGINIEDSTAEDSPLLPINFQQERIAAVRQMAEQEGIPLVINARIDVFLSGVAKSKSERLSETITRGKAYLEAGADCIYPITVGDIETLQQIKTEIDAPINVYASASTAPMHELEDIGISRLSLGPGFLKASLTTMKKVAIELQNYTSYDSFTKDVMTSDEIVRMIEGESNVD